MRVNNAVIIKSLLFVHKAQKLAALEMYKQTPKLFISGLQSTILDAYRYRNCDLNLHQ